MANINITISNAAEIKAAFRRAPELMTSELNTAIKKVVITIQGDSMRNTPVDTGRLRASTYSKYGYLSGEVGTHTNYDVFVHEGTRYMKARPYLLTAIESNENKINDYFTAAVDKVLKKLGDLT